MDYIKIRSLKKEYGTRCLFKHLNFTVTEHTSVGIVGPNGHGKSTLINLVLGKDEADEGNVSLFPGIKIGYFSQYSTLNSENTIFEEMMDHFSQISTSIANLENMSTLMATIDPQTKEFEKISSKYQELYEYIEINDGFNITSRVDLILNKFDFPKDVRHKKVAILSGGEKSRLMLAKILSENNDMLILDEPTNHLDIYMIDWLESYLNAFKGPKVIISHDRYFLDKVITQVLEIENGKWELYTANYSRYEEMKKDKIALIIKQYESQQKQIRKDTEFINKNIARATTSNRAKSRKKQLEKLEIIDKPVSSKKLRDFSFETKDHVSKEVFKFINLEVGFSDQVILETTNLTYFNSKVIGLIGRNGVGKTTLINAIINKKFILNGKIKHSPSTQISYFDQKQTVNNVNEQVLDIFGKWFPHLENGGVRKTLGRFLFDNDGITKKFKNLSGGEKSRLFLAKIFEEKNNFIILDEPTNHLDILSQKVLESALKYYNGALFIISHDRYFMNTLATQIWEIENKKIKVYDGNYNAHVKQKSAQERESTYLIPTYKTKTQIKKEKKEVKNSLSPNKLKATESKILELEANLSKLNNSMFDEEVYNNYEKHEQVQEDIEILELELLNLYELVMT